MKFLPLLALIGAPAFAQTDPNILCPAIGGIAEEIILSYFEGVPLQKVIKITGNEEPLISIVMDAYDEPRYSTDEVIAEATFDFRTRWEHDCFQYYLNNQ